MKIGKTVVFITGDEKKDVSNITYLKNKHVLLQVINSSDTAIDINAKYVICADTAQLDNIANFIKQENKIECLVMQAGFVDSTILKKDKLPEHLRNAENIEDKLLSKNIELSEYIMHTTSEHIKDIYMLGENIKTSLEQDSISKESVKIFENTEKSFSYINVCFEYKDNKWKCNFNLMCKQGRTRNVCTAICEV